MNKIEKNFQEWACSFSGCDGGNPTAPIWLCGIEWGYGKKQKESQEEYEANLLSYYSKELADEIQNGAVVLSTTYDWKSHLEYTFGKSVAKLIMAINGHSVENYPDIEQRCADPRLFKLNLYPIAFRYAGDDLWSTHALDKATGLGSKEAYRAWCFANRFPAFSKEVKKHSPKIIIGVGISYLIDFCVCFAGQDGTGSINIGKLSAKNGDNKSRTYYWTQINGGRTLLVIVPFFSRQNGLNSNELLQLMGEEIASIYKKQIS